MGNNDLKFVVSRNRAAWQALTKMMRTLEAEANRAHKYASTVNDRRTYVSYKQALTMGPKLQKVQDQLSKVQYSYQNLAKLIASGTATHELYMTNLTK